MATKGEEWVAICLRREQFLDRTLVMRPVEHPEKFRYCSSALFHRCPDFSIDFLRHCTKIPRIFLYQKEIAFDVHQETCTRSLVRWLFGRLCRHHASGAGAVATLHGRQPSWHLRLYQ